MAAGRKSIGNRSNAALSIHQGTAAAHQWPSALHELNSQSTLIEVPNSPVVSVYALVLQQISMRRYYLELPATETSGLSTTLSSSSQLATSTYGYNSNGGGLRDLVEPPKSQTLIDRLTTQLSYLVSMTGSLIGTATNSESAMPPSSPPKRQSRINDIAAADSLIQPAYMQPLSMAPTISRKRHRTHAKSPRDSIGASAVLNSGDELRIRCIGALEEIHDRITLPSELSGLPAEDVLGLVSSLLKMHEITYTFVETQRMPMQKALDTSVFPLKTIAAMVSSAYQPPPPPPPVSQTTDNGHHPHAGNIRSLFQGLFSKPAPPQPTSSSHRGGSSRRRLTQLRARASSKNLHQHQQQKQSTLTIVHPHLSAAATTIDQQQQQTLSPPASVPSSTLPGGGDMPEITTTVPVKYATSVLLAQYSPSLNRWRETEVVEYYSCSVRIELVRIGGGSSNLRHHGQQSRRYALLVDQMTGHKGKFSLFKMFLLRIVAALPAMVPEKFDPRPAADPLITVC
ncbi:hypothetical protein IWW38_004955 [Coemansia aciculifera]|uniref:Uncharacterized protein n=1 Tax=Coemansia aciculifera TaxID=417176 RepID=A0ACC1LX46_9FUNG|nr:hypothetical protein IWW38_004955 [Coemansia aciculifera]